MPQIISFYFWEGAIQKDSKQLLLIETIAEKFNELEKFIQTNHSYDLPEIISIKAEKVSEDYSDWVKNSLEN